MKTHQTLQFATIEDLWTFVSKINLTNFEVSASNKILSFDGTEEQFELAISNHNATIIETEKGRKTA